MFACTLFRRRRPPPPPLPPIPLSPLYLTSQVPCPAGTIGSSVPSGCTCNSSKGFYGSPLIPIQTVVVNATPVNAIPVHVIPVYVIPVNAIPVNAIPVCHSQDGCYLCHSCPCNCQDSCCLCHSSLSFPRRLLSHPLSGWSVTLHLSEIVEHIVIFFFCRPHTTPTCALPSPPASSC